MAHNDAVISKMVFQKPDGVTGSLEVHDGDALHGIDGVVTTDLIADKAVTNGKIAEDAVTSAEIAEGAVGTGEIADGVITVDKFSPELKEVWDSKSQEVPIELYPGWTLRAGSFVRIGSLVIFSATFGKSSTINTGEGVFSVPAGYRLADGHVLGYPALICNHHATARLIIDPITGTATINTATTGERTMFDVSGSWRIGA